MSASLNSDVNSALGQKDNGNKFNYTLLRAQYAAHPASPFGAITPRRGRHVVLVATHLSGILLCRNLLFTWPASSAGRGVFAGSPAQSFISNTLDIWCQSFLGCIVVDPLSVSV